jgi:hypothetical protein
MKWSYILIILLTLSLLPGLKSLKVFEESHTEIEIIFENNSKQLKIMKEEGYIIIPKFTVFVKKLGIEDVISSIIILKSGDYKKTVVYSYKLRGGYQTTIDSTKIILDQNYDSANWAINLYGKHSLTELSKIEVFNETYRLR